MPKYGLRMPSARRHALRGYRDDPKPTVIACEGCHKVMFESEGTMPKDVIFSVCNMCTIERVNKAAYGR